MSRVIKRCLLPANIMERIENARNKTFESFRAGALAFPGAVDIHFHGAPGQDVFDGTGDAFETIPSHTLKEDGFPEGSVTDHADCVKQAVDYGLIEMGKNGRKTKGKSVL